MYNLNYFREKLINICEEFVTDDEICYTDWIDTSNCTMYTFFIQNIGFRPAYARAQVSPDKISIINDPDIAEIAPCETRAIVTQKYGFYTRIAFKSLNLLNKTNLKIIFQAQFR